MLNRFDRLAHIAVRYDRRRRYFDSGLWTRTTLAEAFLAAAERQGDQLWHFILSERGRELHLRLEELAAAAARFAGLLRADLTINQDSVIASVVPNSPSAVTAFFGAVSADSVVFTVSQREGPESLGDLLDTVGARHVVIGDQDDRRLAWAREMESAGRLDGIWLGDDAGEIRPAHAGSTAGTALAEVNRRDGVHVISYTSGSTSKPKIVLYTDAQLLSEIHGLRQTIDSRGALLVPSPVGHITGVLNMFLMPLERPDPVVSLDRWSVDAAIELTRRFGCSELRGTTLYFQQMLAAAPDLGGLRAGMAGGGPVAPAIVQRCNEAGVRLVRSYGSTEHPTVTNCLESEPLEIRSSTDGRPTGGTELRLLDEAGEPVAVGTPGEVFSRGPDAMAGYLDPEMDAEFMTPDGWFRTGDVGILSDSGHLTISDRIKDIIIRGAENISAKEVEDQLHEWAAISEVSLVAIPDAIYGERGCAFIQVAGEPVTLDDMRVYLASTSLEKFKWPEQVVIVEDFPRTASGKVRKRALRSHWVAEHAESLA